MIENMKAYKKEHYELRKSRGICNQCGGMAETGKTRCTSCKEIRTEEIRQRLQQRKKDGLCYRCGVKANGSACPACRWRYALSGRKKNVVVSLTEDQMREIMRLPCHYCGRVDERGFNGVDRYDAGGGYTQDNSVPCCRSCNMRKRNSHGDVFIQECMLIAERHCVDAV